MYILNYSMSRKSKTHEVVI